MSDATITVRPGGPYLLTGPVTILDPAGESHEIPAGKTFGLCRCGGSARKPFCDGTHKTNGFSGTDAWPADSPAS